MTKRIFGIVLALVACNVSAETITISLTEQLADTRLVDTGVESYVSLECAGLEPILEPVGAPQLLTTSVMAELPVGATLVEVTYEAEWKVLGESVNLAPVQPLVAFKEDGTIEPAPVVGPDAALYASYPSAIVESCGVQKMAGKSLVPVRVIPFRFANGMLEVASKFVVKVEYTPKTASRLKLALDPTHETAAKGEYIKPEGSTQPDYILIAPKNYFGIWQDYVAERQKDHPEKVMLAKNFAEILAEFPVNTDDDTKGYYARNDAERLHAYIRREAKKGTHYFVLAGSWYDAHGCPADGYVTTVKKELSVTTPQARYNTSSDWGIPGIYTNPRNDSGTAYFVPGQKPCPSDIFYACCDIPAGTKYPWDSGSWDVADPEGDGVYCNEPADRIDLMPDVVVSRIGFICGMTWRTDTYDWTMEKLVKAYLAKVRRVESRDFAGRNRFAGGGHTFSAEPSLADSRTLRDEMEFYTGSENVFDKRRASYWMDTDYVVSLLHKDWFSRYLPAVHNEYVSATTLPVNEPDWETAVKNLHTQDWELSTVMSHGSQGGSMSQVYINEYAQKATGVSKIFFAPFPCLMSYPDWSSVGNRSGTHKLSHNMSLIENPDGGATFTIGNTRSGWGGGIINRDSSVGDGLGDRMGGYFLKAYIRDHKTPGDAWLKMLQTYAPNATGWSTARWVFVIDQALGDPMIETHGPEDYTWEGNKSGEDVWDLATTDKWSHVDEHTGATIQTNYNHAAQVLVKSEGDLSLSVTNKLGALRLVVDQPENATFKLTGEGQLRVATNMVVKAGNVTFATGGGVGHEGLEFTGAKGNIRFEGDKKFYLAKIKNGGTVTFAGSNGLLDLRSYYFSFDTDNLGNVRTQKMSGETIQIDSVAFEGTGENNAIRSDIPGILARYLPSEISGHTIRLETFDGFKGAKDANKSLSIANGGLVIAANPNYGLAEKSCFEAIDIPLSLDNSTLEIERIKTFTLGRDTNSEQTLTVRGTAAITASYNGRLGLYGTTTVDLQNNATLSISAPIDNRGNGKLVFTGSGSVSIDSAVSLAGEVEFGEGLTVTFKALPLPEVKKLTIGARAKVILPKNGSGTYQITPLVGSELTVGAGVTFYNGSLDNPIEGAVANANGSVFDPSGVLAWLGQGDGLWNGRNWLKGTANSVYVADSGTLFSDAPNGQTANTTVNVNGEYFGKFAQFANTKLYTLEGTTDNASLVLGSLTTGGDVKFEKVPLTVSGGVYAMSGKLDAGKVNTEEVHVYGGATYAADKTSFTFDKIRYIRVYFLDHLDDDPDKTTEHRVRMEELYFNYVGSDGTVKTIRDYDISGTRYGGCWVNGSLGVLFDGNDAHKYAVSSEKQYSAELVANSKDDMAAGKVYLQINLKYALPMLASFGVHSSQRTLANREMTHAYRPTRFRIEASYDGSTYYPIMPDFGNRDVGGDNGAYYGGWVGGAWNSFKCNYKTSHPASVEVLAGGAIVADGEYDAAFNLEDGAVVKAVPDAKLTVSETATWNFTEGGKVKIDTSALTLGDEPQVVVEDAKNFSFETLYNFEPSAGASLRYLDGGQIAVVAGDDMNGPYTRTFAGLEKWNTNDWCYQGVVTGVVDFVKFAKPWGDQKLHVATDAVIDLSASAIIIVDCNVEIDTIRACETNNLASSSLAILANGSHVIKAQTLDFSGFDGDVVYGLNCGAAHVIAGQSLKLLDTGTGTLEVPSGATVILTKPWEGEIVGKGVVALAAEDGTWTDLTIFDRIQVPTIEIPEGFRLALPPNDAEAVSAANLKKLVGHGEICYYGDGASTYTSIPSHSVVSTLKFGVDNGVFNLGEVSIPGLIVGPNATLSATSLADTSKIRYVRIYFLKTTSGNKVHLSRLRFSRNGSGLANDFVKASITASPGAVGSSGGASGVYLSEWLKVANPDSFAVDILQVDKGYSLSMSADKMANRELYVTIDFKNNPIDMFTDYSFYTAKTAWGGLPTDWDVEVSTDGQEFVNVASVRGSSTSGNYGGKAVRLAALTVEQGGKLLATGTLAAAINFEAGSVIKVVKDQSLTLGAGATIAFPTEGKVTIDLNGVTIPREQKIDFISGHKFTKEDSARFDTGKLGYGVFVDTDGSLKLEYRGPSVPKVLFK